MTPSPTPRRPCPPRLPCPRAGTRCSTRPPGTISACVRARDSPRPRRCSFWNISTGETTWDRPQVMNAVEKLGFKDLLQVREVHEVLGLDSCANLNKVGA
jgi:hypothetical protein